MSAADPTTSPIRTLLVANRGEIARRIMQDGPAPWASPPWPCTPTPTPTAPMWPRPTWPCACPG